MDYDNFAVSHDETNNYSVSNFFSLMFSDCWGYPPFAAYRPSFSNGTILWWESGAWCCVYCCKRTTVPDYLIRGAAVSLTFVALACLPH